MIRGRYRGIGGLGVATGIGFLPVIAPTVDPVWAYAGFAVVAAVVLVVTRGRLGYLAPPDGAAAAEPAPSTA